VYPRFDLDIDIQVDVKPELQGVLSRASTDGLRGLPNHVLGLTDRLPNLTDRLPNGIGDGARLVLLAEGQIKLSLLPSLAAGSGSASRRSWAWIAVVEFALWGGRGGSRGGSRLVGRV
jgi:hypothetical protein